MSNQPRQSNPYRKPGAYGGNGGGGGGGGNGGNGGGGYGGGGYGGGGYGGGNAGNRGNRGNRGNNNGGNSGGGGNNYRHGGRNNQRGRRQGGNNNRQNNQRRRKKTPKARQPPSKKALVKDIRQACEQRHNPARVAAAVARARHFSLRLDQKSLQLILESVAKIGASTIVADMESILNLRDHNSFLAPAGVHKIIMNLPQCQSVTPTQAAEVVNICVAASRFSRGNQAQEYFRTRCRWCVLEFFGEAKNVLENIERQDPNMLARQGKAVIGAHAEQAKKANEVCFRGGNSGGGQARRELSSGDSVRVSRYPPRRATPAAGYYRAF